MASKIPPQSSQMVHSNHLNSKDLILNRLTDAKKLFIENASAASGLQDHKILNEIKNLSLELPKTTNPEILEAVQKDAFCLSTANKSHLSFISLIEAGIETLYHSPPINPALMHDQWEISAMVKIANCMQEIIQNPNTNHIIVEDLAENLWSLKSQLKEHDENQQFTDEYSEISDILDHMSGLNSNHPNYLTHIESYLSELSPHLIKLKDLI